MRFLSSFLAVCLVVVASPALNGAEKPETRTYQNRLVKNENPTPILADHPEFVAPVKGRARFLAPALLAETGSNLLQVRSWRFSYNARGIIEMPNQLQGQATAVIVVHPWGVDDGQGWRTPQPAGAAFQCTPEKNALVGRHAQSVINPFLKRLRGQVKLVLYSLPGREDPIRRQIYRSFRSQPTAQQRERGTNALREHLNAFQYKGQSVPSLLTVSRQTPLVEYFQQFPGLDASAKFNNEGFWNQPIPVHRSLQTHPDDVVIYDAEGYEPLRRYLKKNGVRHVLLTGYNTDMCVCSTTAGYENLRRDFNVFLVGDATVATFPGQPDPSVATGAAIAFASLKVMITQVSWIQSLTQKSAAKSR